MPAKANGEDSIREEKKNVVKRVRFIEIPESVVRIPLRLAECLEAPAAPTAQPSTTTTSSAPTRPTAMTSMSPAYVASRRPRIDYKASAIPRLARCDIIQGDPRVRTKRGLLNILRMLVKRLKRSIDDGVPHAINVCFLVFPDER